MSSAPGSSLWFLSVGDMKGTRDLELAKSAVIHVARGLLNGLATLEELDSALKKVDECLGLLAPRDEKRRQAPSVVRYYRLKDGQMGLKGPASTIRHGALVDVIDGYGKRSHEYVDTVFWSDGIVSIASIRKISKAKTA